MSVFSGASNIVVNDGQFIAIQAPKDWEKEKEGERDQQISIPHDGPGLTWASKALRQLEQHVAFGAFHNSKERRDPPKCHPRTREAVFREIEEWIQATSTDKPILWLYGPAGAGKSAIAQSIAEKVYRREILGCLLVATFFFNRSNGERSNVDRLVSSLAYQMISSIPGARESVLKAIIENPCLFSLNLTTQMEKLIIEPLLSTAVERSVGEAPGMLIIIDGLDECQDSDERTEVIEALTKSVRNSAFDLIILCLSRPESDIRTAFNDLQTSTLTARLVLDNRFKPDADIEVLLHHGFSEIRRIHPLKNRLPRDWPPGETIEALVRKSSGQFIYASTVMKYIASRKHNPLKRLEVILDVGSGTDASPFKELDALYMLALSSVDENDRPALIRIIGMICFPGLYGEVLLTPELIDDVLGLEPGRTLLILDGLHSLIHVRDSEDLINLNAVEDADLDDSEEMSSDDSENTSLYDSGVGLKPFHASFGDFLKDRSRSEKYYVEHTVVEADCALAYFRGLFNTILNPSDIYYLIDRPRRHFGGNLTPELFELFTSVPWQSLVGNGLPSCLPVVGLMTWSNHPWIVEVSEFYRFCEMASGTSPTWASISKLAVTEVTGWLAGYFNLISSSADLEDICTIQDGLRLRYIGKLLKIESDFTRDPGAFIIDILRTPGLSLMERIDRRKHNFAIFDTILEGLVTTRFAHHAGTLHDDRPSKQLGGVCEGCMEIFVGLLDSADRTPHIDALLACVEGKNSPHSILRSQENVKRAIATYKEKPISDDYDHDCRLEPSLEVLRQRFKVVRSGSSKYDYQIGLSDLGVCNFIRFEKFRPW